MSLLDDILRLFGTNRMRVRWQLQKWREQASRKQRSLANRSQSLTYEHQLCPKCGHPAAKDEKTCTRCGARLYGATVSRASRALGWLVPEGVPVVTMVYIAACVALYVVTWKASYDFYGEDYGGGFKPAPLMSIRFGANFRDLVQQGEWWRLVTANFLHVDLWHIALNAYGLWVAGSVIEDRFGAARTAFVVLVTAVAGAAASYAYGGGFSAGASTAGFGMIGFVVGHALRYRGQATADLRDRFIPWLLYGIIMSFGMQGKIDLWGHLGGVGAGLVLGLVVADKQQADRLPNAVWNVVALACLAVVGWSFFMAAQWQLPETIKVLFTA